jgi:hypothetical protein
MAMNGQTFFCLPAVNRAHFALQKGSDLFPGVQAIILRLF